MKLLPATKGDWLRLVLMALVLLAALMIAVCAFVEHQSYMIEFLEHGGIG